MAHPSSEDNVLGVLDKDLWEICLLVIMILGISIKDSDFLLAGSPIGKVKRSFSPLKKYWMVRTCSLLQMTRPTINAWYIYMM